MNQVQYIDKTFPITLQDLLDLARSKNLDPRDLKIIQNDYLPDYTGYTQCAALNQDGPDISIELYQHNGYPQPKSKPNNDLPRFDKAYNILDQIRDLNNLDIHIVSDIDLKDLDEALTILTRFYKKQLTKPSTKPKQL